MFNTKNKISYSPCQLRSLLFCSSRLIHVVILLAILIGAAIHFYIYKAHFYLLTLYMVLFLTQYLFIINQKHTTVVNFKLISLLEGNGDILFWINNDNEIISCESNEKCLAHLVERSKHFKFYKLNKTIIKKVLSEFSKQEDI